MCGFGCGNENIIWILLLLCCCGNNDGCGSWGCAAAATTRATASATPAGADNPTERLFQQVESLFST